MELIVDLGLIYLYSAVPDGRSKVKIQTHKSAISLLMITPLANPASPSHHEGFAFTTPKVMP